MPEGIIEEIDVSELGGEEVLGQLAQLLIEHRDKAEKQIWSLLEGWFAVAQEGDEALPLLKAI